MKFLYKGYNFTVEDYSIEFNNDDEVINIEGKWFIDGKEIPEEAVTLLNELSHGELFSLAFDTYTEDREIEKVRDKIEYSED